MSLLPPKERKSTKSVIMFINRFSIGDFKLLDREGTVVNEIKCSGHFFPSLQ